MSDERTVLDAIGDPFETFIASDGVPSIRPVGGAALLKRLSIDPDMTVRELQENLKWGKRVRHTNVIDFHGWTASELLEKHLRREINER